MMFSWKFPPAAPLTVIAGVVADHARGQLHHRFAHHGIDFARHDRTARLPAGQFDFVEPATRAAAEPANVVGDIEQRLGDALQLAMRLNQSIALGVGLEVIDRFDKRNACLFCQNLCDPRSKFWMRVDAATDRRAADRQFQHRVAGRLGARRSKLQSAARIHRIPAPVAAASHPSSACGRS